jgi:hypothetical protein
MRPTRQVARLSETAATLAGFVATEDRGRSIRSVQLKLLYVLHAHLVPAVGTKNLSSGVVVMKAA